MAQIKKLLVANRGEIAVRIFRTCKDLGITTVAVFSDADRGAWHVRMADEAVRIGPAASSESYLNQDAIVAAIRKSGADAVHPGYGFLSENFRFAQRCLDEGIVFVGPPPAAIETMGDKTEARRMMRTAGVPMAPGSEEAVSDPVEAEALASEIGFPVLVKAAAGGGGKGMRIVKEAADFRMSFEAAQREAGTAFGDPRVYLERYIQRPRHIEVQILADSHGNVIHLLERDCSIQRRHQKVIEECPSSVLDDDLRRQMGTAAVKAAVACGYVSAGTVEFLLDSSNNFYFMEMNTRLQVEHAVTEEVTGIDLVQEQIRIAEGEPLSLRQEDVTARGHAIECRVYAEDPSSNFLPDPGNLRKYVEPAGPGIRVDSGVVEGSEIPIYYDPMIAKVVAWGKDRDAALKRMLRALDEYQIAGVRTTIPFCQFVVAHPAFTSGEFSTHFVEDEFSPDLLRARDASETMAVAVAAAFSRSRSDIAARASTNGTLSGDSAGGGQSTLSPWASNRRKRRGPR